MKERDYQHDLSLHSPILLDLEYKSPKVRKMLSILQDADAIGGADRKMLAVDIGCSGGFFTNGIAPFFQNVLGMDIDFNALLVAHQQREYENLHYIGGDSMSLPLPDNSVDLVICNHVYEHVPDPERLFSEIHRILKSDGICYLGAASRWIPMEPHYHLLFLSWLPKYLAHRYMRFFGKGNYYYENLKSYGGIKRLIRNFRITDYTLKIIKNPEQFHATDMIPKNGLVSRLPLWVWKLSYRVLPTYILILRK